MWKVVFLLAVAGSTVLADLSISFPEIARGSRIITGWEAQEGQFPHMIALRMVNPTGTFSLCGATIIHEEWGLTAAHCAANRVALIIRAGTINSAFPSLVFETTVWYNHPLFNDAMSAIVQPNDISLIYFGRKITFSDTVQPIRMQRSDDSNRNYEGTQAIASGWGRTTSDGPSSLTLNWVYLSVISNPDCLRAFGNSPIVQPSSICAEPYNVTSQSVCMGDSGGPLTIIDDDGVLTQVGVCAFVISGCQPGFPSGFVRPGHYHDWFTEVTGISFDWEYSSGKEFKKN